MIPDWLNGADLTSVQAQGYKADMVSAGPGPFNLTGATVSCAMEQREDAEDVRPINSLQMNSVQTGVGVFLTLEVLANRTAASSIAGLVNLLSQWSTYPYVLVQFTAGELAYDAIFRIGGFRGLGVSQRAGNRISVDLMPVNPGYNVGQAGVGTTGTVTTVGGTQSVIHNLA